MPSTPSRRIQSLKMPDGQAPPRQRPPTRGARSESDPGLRDLLAQKTSALDAAQLRLRTSDRLVSIGALAAGLGHDMNNVLLPVRAHLEAAKASAMKPAVRRHVDAVLKSVAYLQQLADGLHFLTMNAEGDERERDATDLETWWSRVGSLLTRAVPKHVRVAVSLPPGLPAVAVSMHGLTQAVLNVVVNAGEAIPPPEQSVRRNRTAPGGLVRIAAKTDERGASVVLSVTDNGRGMCEDTKRRAFEMFYTTRTRGLGTGLGLPLVARVVSRAGGSVHIESRIGRGTKVSLRLPIAVGAEMESGLRRAVVTVADGRDAAMIRHLLELSGIRADSAADPAEAQVWVAEPTGETLRAARVWRKQHPRGGLVLVGGPSPASARAWKALSPRIIRDRTDLEAIRSALGQAIASL